MKTKITLVNGDVLIVDKTPEDIIKYITGDYDKIFNQFIEISKDVWIVSGHIVKLERISEDENTIEDDDAVVLF